MKSNNVTHTIRCCFFSDCIGISVEGVVISQNPEYLINCAGVGFGKILDCVTTDEAYEIIKASVEALS